MIAAAHTQSTSAASVRRCFTSSQRSLPKAPLRSSVLVKAEQDQPASRTAALASTVGKAAAAALLSASFLVAGPSTADGLDTDTVKKGLKATIEASDITKEKAADVVSKLKATALDATEKLSSDASGSGSSYPASVVQELETVRNEIASLEKQLAAGGGDESVIKSTASGIEQQLNALKGILGFD